MSLPRRVGIIGAGGIGSGWAALFAAYGAEVRIFDRDADAERRARATLTDAVRLGVGVDHLGSVDAYFDLDDTIDGAEWVQESLPEDLDTKRDILGSLERKLSGTAIVASSSSSFTATELAQGLSFEERLVIAHPLHPVYAVPLVELCCGSRTKPATLERATAIMLALGREPIVVRSEVRGLVSNRLTAALLREAFDLVARGVVTASELDRVVTRGIGLGWVAEGPLATEIIGAGSAGFAGYLDRLQQPLSAIWSSLAIWTELDSGRRESLEREVGISMASRHYAGAASDTMWSEMIVRVLRATESSEQETGP